MHSPQPMTTPIIADLDPLKDPNCGASSREAWVPGLMGVSQAFFKWDDGLGTLSDYAVCKEHPAEEKHQTLTERL